MMKRATRRAAGDKEAAAASKHVVRESAPACLVRCVHRKFGHRVRLSVVIYY